MESILSRFTPTRTSSPLYSRPPLRLRSSLQLPARLRHLHLRLCSSGGGSRGTDATEDEASKPPEDDIGTLAGKLLDAYRNSNNDLTVRTFLQNLVDAGLADESEVFGGEDDELLRSLLDADLPGRSPDLGVLWKLPAVAAFSFAGVPALLGYLGEAAGVDRVPAWMPLAYSLASFVVGSLLVADASFSDEEWDEWVGRRERGGDLSFLESEEVLWRTARRVPAAALAATAAGEAALRAAGAGGDTRGHRGRRGGPARGGRRYRARRPAAAPLGGVPAVRPPPGRVVRGVLGELRPRRAGLVARLGRVRHEHPRRCPPRRRRRRQRPRAQVDAMTGGPWNAEH